MGKLFAWGDNFDGRLGNNSVTNTSSPVQIGDTDNWVKVSVHDSSFAVKEDGTMWSWGMNYSGLLGDNTTTHRSSPVQIGFNNVWSSVKTHGLHAFAMRNDNTIWAWGVNYNGMLGDNSTEEKSSPVQVGSDSDWAEFATGEGFGAGVKENGTLWIWGNNYYGVFGNDSVNDVRSSPVQLGSDTNWDSIYCGEFSIAAIKKNGSLWSWGRNSHGVLGDGTTEYKSSPIQIGGDTDWKQVSVCGESNNGFALAIKNDGSLWAWGRNNYGQLGDSTEIDKSSPIQIGSENNWSYVAAGNGASYGIKIDDTLWVWGSNNDGNYGDETNTLASSPIQVMTNKVGWTEISAFFHVLGTYNPSNPPTKSCSSLSCPTPAFKCYVGATDSCSCAKWKFYTAQCTRIQQALGICSGTSGAYVPAIVVCNQKLF